MAKILIAGALLLPLAGCTGLFGGVQGSGKSATETRTVSGFNKIETEGAMDVVVRVGPQASLKVTSDDNIVPLMKTTVQGQTLTISLKENCSTKLGVRVEVTTPTLDGFSIAGSAGASIEGIDSQKFTAEISGSGDITLKGKASSVDLEINGSGQFKAEDLAAENAAVTINGSGSAGLRVEKKLQGTINGSGQISYTGNPSVEKVINGSGSISQK